MNLENTGVQMKKGILEFCVLQIISRGETYASDMLTELSTAKMVVVEGTLYPLLTRLKNAGLLDYQWKESTSGPPRKYYTLTAKGLATLKEMHEQWQEISSAIATILAHQNGYKPINHNETNENTIEDSSDLANEPSAVETDSTSENSNQ